MVPDIYRKPDILGQNAKFSFKQFKIFPAGTQNRKLQKNQGGLGFGSEISEGYFFITPTMGLS